jgi:protein-S-isoprenylcysteine O-methyltransferase Ste14
MQALLSRELNLSSVEADTRPRASLILKHYAVSSALYGLLLVLLAVNPWFKVLVSAGFGGVTALQVYGLLYLLYLVAALPVLLVCRPRSLCRSKNLLLFELVWRAAAVGVRRLRGQAGVGLSISFPEKQALMFLLIRLFFGPLILNALLVELGWCQRLGTQFRPVGLIGKLDVYYIVFVHLIFLADSVLYFVGYHTEAACLRNEVRYVETDLWRILVCVLCYPPFNQATLSLVGASCQDPYLLVQGNLQSAWTWGLRGAAVLLLCLLISASLSLFTRASNLTNRGIVSWGPYRFVRHPGYLAQNLYWFITLVPWIIPNPRSVYFSWSSYSLGCLCLVGGFIAWATLYFLRAVSEEQFLSRDPDYVAYCKRVRYRFIPGLY